MPTQKTKTKSKVTAKKNTLKETGDRSAPRSTISGAGDSSLSPGGSHVSALEAEIEAKATHALERTEFAGDGWRTVPELSAYAPQSKDEVFWGGLSKQSRDEFDFSDLPVSLFKFAEIWERSRELSECYDQRFKNLPPLRVNPFIPPDESFQRLWASNKRFFPLPIMTLIRAGVFKRLDESQASAVFDKTIAVRELEPTLFSSLAFQSEPQPLEIAGFDGKQKTIKLPKSLEDSGALTFLRQFPTERWKEIIGIGTQSFWSASKLPRPGEAAHVSFHAIAIDWERGKDAIKSEIEEWIDRRRADFSTASDSKVVSRDTNRGQKPSDSLRTPLARLAAWRALRVGYKSQGYFLYRAVWARILESAVAPAGDPALKKLAAKFKEVTQWPRYLRQGDFKKKAEEAEEDLRSLRDSIRKPPSRSAV